MKVALTVWDDRISPVFDSARMLLIAEIKDNEVINRQYQTFDPSIPLQLLNMLKGQDISVIICGAISEIPANRLEAEGIELIPFISGNVNEILETYSKGLSIIKEYIMPGCGEKKIGKGAGKRTHSGGLKMCRKHRLTLINPGQGHGGNMHGKSFP